MESERFDCLRAFDLSEISDRGNLLAGVDEAGRGPLAGPVVAAAVILPINVVILGLNDSKKISPRRREILYEDIKGKCLVGVGIADEQEIDTLNILQASRLAMKKAVLALPCTPDLVLIDGRETLDLAFPQKAVIGGDGKSASIAAASIIAKVYRDRLMDEWHETYPAYNFKKHKGYPTRDHIQKIREVGPCPIHRKSFGPVQEAWQQLGITENSF
ncbi:MAG: ribonuclease HII [Candidatus Omnitrophica bacterium]|nr:ribonuclease HII [Candidatus Omnitrophota bacterium]